MDSCAWLRALLSVGVLLLAPAVALADAQGPAYGGVRPGEATSEPAEPRGAWTDLSWIGFLPEAEGGGRVFAQLDRKVRVDQAIVEGTLWLMLDRVRPASKNATRPLDVRFFDTDLKTVRAEKISRRSARGDKPRQPEGTKLIVTFKDSEDARKAETSVVREEDGYHYLYLDFGPSS